MGVSHPCFYNQNFKKNKRNPSFMRISSSSKTQDINNNKIKRNYKSFRGNNDIRISIKKTYNKNKSNSKEKIKKIYNSIHTNDVPKRFASDLNRNNIIKTEINKNEENIEKKIKRLETQTIQVPIKRSTLTKREKNSNIKKFIKGNLREQNEFCIIYSGLSITTGEIVTIKEYINLSIEQKKLIINHNMKLNKLHHPNIVNILKKISLSSDNNSEFDIIFESGNLDPLENLISKYGTLDEKIIQKYGKQILLGLQYLHKNNIYHKNLNLKNILVDTDGTVKIEDYLIDGIILGNEKDIYNYYLNETNIKYYIPPFFIKYINNANDSDIFDNNKMNEFWQAYDLWFVGCILIESISGKKPWSHYKFKNNYEFFDFLNTTNKIPIFPQKISLEFNELLQTLLNPSLTKNGNIYEIILNLQFFSKNTNDFRYNKILSSISNSVKKNVNENNDTIIIGNESDMQLGKILANNKVVNILNSTNNQMFSISISNEESSITSSAIGNNLCSSNLFTKNNEFKKRDGINTNRIKSLKSIKTIKSEMPPVNELQSE